MAKQAANSLRHSTSTHWPEDLAVYACSKEVMHAHRTPRSCGPLVFKADSAVYCAAVSSNCAVPARSFDAERNPGARSDTRRPLGSSLQVGLRGSHLPRGILWTLVDRLDRIRGISRVRSIAQVRPNKQRPRDRRTPGAHQSLKNTLTSAKPGWRCCSDRWLKLQTVVRRCARSVRVIPASQVPHAAYRSSIAARQARRVRRHWHHEPCFVRLPAVHRSATTAA